MQGLIELEGTARSVVGDRLRICGIEPGGLIESQVGDAVEWADTDRLRRSWDPNRDPKLPETGRISGVLERTIDPLTPELETT